MSTFRTRNAAIRISRRVTNDVATVGTEALLRKSLDCCGFGFPCFSTSKNCYDTSHKKSSKACTKKKISKLVNQDKSISHKVPKNGYKRV